MSRLEEFNLASEEKVRKFWREKKVAEKARKLNAKGAKKFYMMDGPPYASGHIHMGTALNKIVKDITLRQKRMQGFKVRDQPGYDTHGLPIENKVEKKLGFKTKAEIENYGVEKFIHECRKYATEYIGIMNEDFNNLGVWMDWENPYLTLNNEYIEAIWWTFKRADEKGLLYLGKYPVHVCSHCETAVAYNEIEYTKQTDESIYVKFRVKGMENTFLIIWTTTPWTLPSNTGVMAHPKFDYVEAEVGGTETWILAKERLQQLMDAAEAGYVIKKEFKGKEIEGLEYENPLAKHMKLPPLEKAYRVILSDRYVNLEEGTGLVHTAPGCGKEDFDAGTKAGLPVLSLVDNKGLLSAETGKYSGKKARVVDEEIISDLKEGGALIYRHPYTHDYPVCWRCHSPLLMISTPQWFFRVSGIQEKMIQLNEKVEWYPPWGKDRFRNWLENLGDWPVSRQRYWGTPLPIWMCNECGNKKVVGSRKELKQFWSREIKDLHKPWIDEVKWNCKKCGKGVMRRVPEVLDVWFDSGVTSWGSIGYPESEKLFKEYWPADLNIEGKDQIRGWWNSQLITSTICFDRAPFKAIAMHGMVLDLDKKKMSKSVGNIVSPQEVIQKYGRDFLRLYIAREFSGEDMVFDREAFKEISRFYNTLWNSYNYADTYLELSLKKHAELKGLKGLAPEDKWILSKLHSLVKSTLAGYNSYAYSRVASEIEYFVLEEFSRTYIKMVRDRVKGEKKTLGTVFSHVFSVLLRLLAPLAPHAAEHFYLHSRRAGMAESIHYAMLPKGNLKMIDSTLESEMAKAKELVQAVLSMREEQKLRLRWPLREIVFVSKSGKEFGKTKGVLAGQCNVKKFSEAKSGPEGKFVVKEFGAGKIFLKTEADEKLKEEWELMELRRRIQDLRKQMKLNPNEKVPMEIACSDEKFLKKYAKEIEGSTNTKIIAAGKSGKAEKVAEKTAGKMEKVLEREFYIRIKN